MIEEDVYALREARMLEVGSIVRHRDGSGDVRLDKVDQRIEDEWINGSYVYPTWSSYRGQRGSMAWHPLEMVWVNVTAEIEKRFAIQRAWLWR